MKVLMYGWEFPPHISGGLGVACHAMVTELSKKNIQVTLVLPQEITRVIDGNLSIVGCAAAEDAPAAFAIKRAPLTTWLSPYLNQQDYQYLSSNNALLDLAKLQQLDFFKHLGAVDSMRLTGKYGTHLFAEVLYYAMVAGKLAQTVEHDVIHAHDWLTILAGVEAKKYSKKPLFFHIHALEVDRSGEHNNYNVFAIEKYGMEHADKVIAVSQYTKNNIVKYYGISPDKIAIIHNGTYPVKGARERTLPRTKTVLFVGRLTYQKGPDFFIEAAKKVLAFRKDVKFILVGTGDLMRGLVERIAVLGIGQYVHFAGFLTPAMVAKIYSTADLYIMPSVSEPFGLTCLEALAREVPVIISKQSGVAEVLQHVLKVDFWDIDEMTNKILAVLAHPPLSHTMVTNVKKEIKELTWDKTADAIIDLYRSVGS